MLSKRLNEPKEVMDLINYIIDTSSHSDKGLNLGSEAPQIFAIYYLSGLDNYIKIKLGVKYYGRYMDDMFIFCNSKEELKSILQKTKEQLGKLKLEINEKKTHIVKLSHGFTYMQIKYSIDGKKIIKRPTRSKITRERRRLKKYKRLFDKGLMNETNILNCYKSWRNNVIKDCNCSYRSIKRMDEYYKSLFPVYNTPTKLGRNKSIDRAYENVSKEVLCDL